MGKIRLPRLDTNPPDLESIELLCRNMDLILRHMDVVVGTPDWHDIHIEGLAVENYLTGRLTLRLGELVRLWERGAPWIQVREDDTVLVYGGIGSILNNNYQLSGWSRNQQKIVHFKPLAGSLLRFYGPARDLIKGTPGEGGKTEIIGPGSILAPKPPQRGISERTVAELLTALNELEGRFEN